MPGNSRTTNQHESEFTCLILEPLLTVRHIEYCQRKIRMMRYYGVEPYLVFDGDNLPTKARVEKEREKCVSV